MPEQKRSPVLWLVAGLFERDELAGASDAVRIRLDDSKVRLLGVLMSLACLREEILEGVKGLGDLGMNNANVNR